MNVSFDRQADAAYIKISTKKINKTLSTSEYCNVDIDEDGAIVGIELLFISEYMNDFKSWISIGDAAAYLNKSPLTIRRWTKNGSLPSYKIGKEYRFLKEELDDYIQSNRVKLR